MTAENRFKVLVAWYATYMTQPYGKKVFSRRYIIKATRLWCFCPAGCHNYLDVPVHWTSRGLPQVQPDLLFLVKSEDDYCEALFRETVKRAINLHKGADNGSE